MTFDYTSGFSSLMGEQIPLQLGSTGKIRQKEFKIIGHLHFSYIFGSWDDWYLEFTDGHAILSDNGLTKTFFQIIPEAPGLSDTPVIGEKFTIDGTTFYLNELDQLSCTTCSGTLPWTTDTNERIDYIHATSSNGKQSINIYINNIGLLFTICGERIAADDLFVNPQTIVEPPLSPTPVTESEDNNPFEDFEQFSADDATAENISAGDDTSDNNMDPAPDGGTDSVKETFTAPPDNLPTPDHKNFSKRPDIIHAAIETGEPCHFTFELKQRLSLYFSEFEVCGRAAIKIRNKINYFYLLHEEDGSYRGILERGNLFFTFQKCDTVDASDLDLDAIRTIDYFETFFVDGQQFFTINAEDLAIISATGELPAEFADLRQTIAILSLVEFDLLTKYYAFLQHDNITKVYNGSRLSTWEVRSLLKQQSGSFWFKLFLNLIANIISHYGTEKDIHLNSVANQYNVNNFN